MSTTFLLITPELALIASAFLALGVGLSARWRVWCAPVTLAGILLATTALITVGQLDMGQGQLLFGGMLAWDAVARFFKWLTLGVLLFITLLAWGDRGVEAAEHGEYYCLLQLVGVGMMLLSAAHHWLLVVLAMELISLSGYLLVAFARRDARASEAALKYFLFGALMSALFLYGLSLLYALTHTLDLSELRPALFQLTPAHSGLLLIAGTLLLIGFGFKISMAPFHLWTPDAYEGAPIPVAALLSIGPKAAGLAVIVRIFGVGFGRDGLAWIPLIAGLSVLTMSIGNLTALVQTNVKRLLAYSTIAQVGYLLMGIAAANRVGEAAVWLYLVAYLCMNAGAFAVVSAITNVTGNESLDAYRGLAQRAPQLALLFALFLLSLAGIPPLAGFIGKFYLFGAALSAQRVWLAVAGAINSVIALYYYVNLIRLMYLQPPTDRTAITVPWPLTVAIWLAAAGTLVIGIYPTPLLDAIAQSLVLF